MFDKNAYRNNVLKPLHKNPVRKSAVEEALRQVQAAQGAPAVIEALSVADAAALFAITPGLPDAQIGDHVSDLRIFLNGAQRLYPVAKTLALLLEAIKDKVPGAYVTADFWKEVGEKTADAAKQRLSSFAAAVKQNGPLDVISPDELRQAAVAAGLAAFTDQDLAKAVGAKGVRVCEDFDPPQVNLGAPPLRQALSPSFRSLVDAMVLHERGVSPGEIRVISEFSAVLGPARRRPVTMADLKKSQQTVDANNKYAGGGGQLTLTAIRQQCSTDEDLRKLALGWFLDRAAQLRGQGLLLLVALEKLKSSGLADLDARRIMAKATSGAPAGPDFGGVADLIAAGDLRGARLLLTTLTGADPADQTPEFKQAAAQVAAAEQKKDQALEAYRRALDAHDYPAAALRLAEAQAIDVEDEEIRRLEAQIPPAAPTGLQAAFLPAKGVVALSWRGARGPDVTYTVLRTQSGVPANPKAGTPVASPAADQRAVDPKPPVARAVAYAVFACRASGAYSAPASVQIVALPPPMDVKTAVTSTDVTVSWRVLPEATGVAVELIGPDGSKQSFAAPKGNRLTVKARELGRKHVILLRANYLVGGRLATSPEVSVEVIPRGAVQPVRDLAVASAALASGKPGLRAEWTAVTGYPTDLWLAPINQQINPGGRVSRADLDAMTATPVTGSA
ncbi:MAG: hypothetical protein LBD70_00175, partial [Bifidobacteriaceae bacterium]|nr:hypothetical protein [Bifidobacteriaceae bacterium]